MSHLATIKTQFKDIEAVAEAAKSLGCTLQQGGKTRMYGSAQACGYTITLPGYYDVGFQKQPDGTYSVVCDTEIMLDRDNGRNNDARRILGNGLSRLKQEYSYGVAAKQARKQGMSVFRTTREDGAQVVTLRRG